MDKLPPLAKANDLLKDLTQAQLQELEQEADIMFVDRLLKDRLFEAMESDAHPKGIMLLLAKAMYELDGKFLWIDDHDEDRIQGLLRKAGVPMVKFAPFPR